MTYACELNLNIIKDYETKSVSQYLFIAHTHNYFEYILNVIGCILKTVYAKYIA